MKILSLIITQANFDKIISGVKKTENREIRPSSERKYVEINDEGAITDIVFYDAIRLYVGYNRDRSSALVEIKDAQLIEIVDDNDNLMYFEYKGVQHQMIDIEYSLGAILEKNIK